MSKTEDLTGQRFGRLTAIKYAGKRYWECRCDCGNTKLVKSNNLKSGGTLSCGCLSKETAAENGRKSIIDLTGKRFGKLVAVRYDPVQKKWECRCDCGNICFVAQNNLCRKKKPTISCGCAISLENANKANIVDHTSVGNIRTKEATSRSKTGVKGVYPNQYGGYTATIRFKNKVYYLCSSQDINVCIAARKEAEKRLHDNFLEFYDSLVTKAGNKICPVCKKEYTPTGRNQKYCSQDCRYANMYKRIKDRRAIDPEYAKKLRDYANERRRERMKDPEVRTEILRKESVSNRKSYLKRKQKKLEQEEKK